MDMMRFVLSTMLLGLVLGGGLPTHAQEKSAEPAPLAQALQQHDEFSTLVSVSTDTGMKATLASENEYTVLAPTDEALSEADVQSMSTKEKKALLRNHLLDGTYPASEVAKMEKVQTLEGDTVSVKKKESGIQIGNGTVVEKNVEASNGVIHAVDDVIVSPDSTETQKQRSTQKQKQPKAKSENKESSSRR